MDLEFEELFQCTFTTLEILQSDTYKVVYFLKLSKNVATKLTNLSLSKGSLHKEF